MEQADYEGSLAMLRRIAGALNRRLELRAVPTRAQGVEDREGELEGRSGQVRGDDRGSCGDSR